MAHLAEEARKLLPPDLQRQWAEQDAKEAKLAEQMRVHCADTIANVADALRFPKIARRDLEAAQVAIAKALSIACVLDPE